MVRGLDDCLTLASLYVEGDLLTLMQQKKGRCLWRRPFLLCLCWLSPCLFFHELCLSVVVV